MCRNARCTFFFFVSHKIGSCTISCDILWLSLIYVSPTSEYGGGKPIKQFSQPANTSFFHLGTHLFYIEGNGKEGKVHEDLVHPKMAETLVVHIVFHLSEHSFRFYTSLSPVFQTFLGAEQLFGFLPVSPEPVIQFNRPVPLCLKHRHLSGQPSHLTALYLAFSLTYPDAVFTRLVPILRIFCPMGQMQKSCSSL